MSIEKDFIKECSFELISYDKGLLLRFPLLDRPDKVMPFVDHPNFFRQLQDYAEWGRLLDVDCVGNLNSKIYGGHYLDIIHISEGLHMKNVCHVLSHDHELVSQHC